VKPRVSALRRGSELVGYIVEYDADSGMAFVPVSNGRNPSACPRCCLVTTGCRPGTLVTCACEQAYTPPASRQAGRVRDGKG